MKFELIFAGFGGQGVMLMGQLMAYSGMYEGKHVTWFPAYGPEMRGGTANCSVVIDDEPIGSPVITEPGVVVAMNQQSLDKFERAVAPGGTLFYNSSLINNKPIRTDIKLVAIPANDIAAELGNPKVANIVCIGAVLKSTSVLNPETVMKVLEEKVLSKKQDLVAVNRAALERGMQIL
jgi:2-oxoglutarate ferredoxin oxidoreductase subunit gamma